MNSKKHADKKEVFLFVMDYLKSLKDEASSSQASKLPKLSKIVTAASQVVARGLREKFFSVRTLILMFIFGFYVVVYFAAFFMVSRTVDVLDWRFRPFT